MEKFLTKEGRNFGEWSVRMGEYKPSFSCPDCGGILLGDRSSHKIDIKGEVNPSVKCSCGFHKIIKLVGYKGVSF